MTKNSINKINEMGYRVYSLNTVSSYIKGGKLKNQINVKKVGSGMFYVSGEGIEGHAACENTILEMLG